MLFQREVMDSKGNWQVPRNKVLLPALGCIPSGIIFRRKNLFDREKKNKIENCGDEDEDSGPYNRSKAPQEGEDDKPGSINIQPIKESEASICKGAKDPHDSSCEKYITALPLLGL